MFACDVGEWVKCHEVGYCEFPDLCSCEGGCEAGEDGSVEQFRKRELGTDLGDDLDGVGFLLGLFG